MRIAYVVHQFPPESVGGTEVYTWSLAHAMARAGHNVWIFYPSESPGKRHDGDISIWAAAQASSRLHLGPATTFWRTFRGLELERAWRRFLSETRPDIVHIQHLQGISARLPHLANVPLVATLHDYWYLCANGQMLLPDHTICSNATTSRRCAVCGLAKAGLPQSRAMAGLAALPFAYRNRVVRDALAQFDLMVSPSRFLRQRYVDAGAAPQKIMVMENGLDHRRLAVDPPSEPTPSHRLRLTFIGSIAWQKGVHVLVDALNRVDPAITATIYGNLSTFPDYAASLRQSIARPGIDLAGSIDHAEVGRALRQTDYLVVPSLWFENSPVVIQEAYALGIPVIASNLGALPDKVHDGVTGRLFPVGDAQALTDLITELDTQPELGLTYRKNIEPGPTIDENADTLAGHYQRLVQSHRH